MLPEENGWSLINNKLQLLWFEGPLVPDDFVYPEEQETYNINEDELSEDDKEIDENDEFEENDELIM
jgi:hypothetical protein